MNTIDLDAAKQRGIAVCNLPGTNARAVAGLTLALMLAVLRRLPRFDAAMRRGEWLIPDLRDGIGEFGGRPIGLVGYGAIPRLLAPVLIALGCRLIYTSRTPRADALGEWRSLDALLAEADVVSLHLPLTDDTADLINGAAFARMKPGAVLINTARGGLVDQPALTEALASGRLAGAGLDVFVHEPHDASDVLFQLPNVLLTHTSPGSPPARSIGVSSSPRRTAVASRPASRCCTEWSECLLRKTTAPWARTCAPATPPWRPMKPASAMPGTGPRDRSPTSPARDD